MKRIAMIAVPLVLLAGIAGVVFLLARRHANAGAAEAVEHVEPEGRRSNADDRALLEDAATLGLTHFEEVLEEEEELRHGATLRIGAVDRLTSRQY
jgi:hypothetical protein